MGTFKEGSIEGEGVMTHPDGSVQKGIWRNNNFESEKDNNLTN